jgi:psp operon transcriptional activator
VRELRNAAERATFRTMAAQANGAPLGPVSITPDLLDPFNSPWRPPRDLSEMPPLPAAQPVRAAQGGEVIEAAALPTPDAAAGPVNFNETIEALEKKLIESALSYCRGHQKKAAERLGLSYHQMRGLLRKYGFGREGGSEEAAADGGSSAKQI